MDQEMNEFFIPYTIYNPPSRRSVHNFVLKSVKRKQDFLQEDAILFFLQSLFNMAHKQQLFSKN